MSEVKPNTPMNAIIIWCKEWKTNYAGFQQMETLGYLKVLRVSSKKYRIQMLEPNNIVSFLRRAKED